MPELPDVEILREILKDRVTLKPILFATEKRLGVLQTDEPLLDVLKETSILDIDRKGMFPILLLDSGIYVVVDLDGYGRLLLCRSVGRVTKATAFVIRFTDGSDLRLIENGPERAAKIHIVEDLSTVDQIQQMGIDPLSEDFTAHTIEELADGKRRRVKELLVDQRLISGIGPRWADEILLDAGISPIRYVNRLGHREFKQLHSSIVDVLQTGISTIRNELGDGHFPDAICSFLKVYKQTGKPCFYCGTRIEEIRYARKRTYYCPNCQRNQ